MTILNACAALLVYGGWAIFVNFEYGQEVWLISGLAQGCYAFASTMTVTGMARWCYFRCGCGKEGMLVGFLVSFAVMLLIPLSVHQSVGTPDILETIMPGLIGGVVYLSAVLLITERQRLKSIQSSVSSM